MKKVITKDETTTIIASSESEKSKIADLLSEVLCVDSYMIDTVTYRDRIIVGLALDKDDIKFLSDMLTVSIFDDVDTSDLYPNYYGYISCAEDFLFSEASVGGIRLAQFA